MSRRWTHAELMLAMNLYCRLPFGKFHQHNPDVIRLAGLRGLQRLHLGGTQVSDLAPLGALVDLRQLYLSHSDELDVQPLQHLESLNIERL